MPRLLIALVLAQCVTQAAVAQGAPRTQPAHIAVLVSSDQNRCFEPGTVRAIKRFARDIEEEANRGAQAPSGRIAVDILDDFENAETATANVRKALASPDLVAMIGLPSSTRGKAVLEALGREIAASEVPFVSEISMNGLFAAYPNVYSMASTVDNELDVVKRFIRDKGFQRVAFIGLADDDYARALGDGLGRGADAVPLVAERRILAPEYSLAPADGAAILAELREKAPDLIVLAVQSGAGGQLVKTLASGGVRAPVLVLYGRLARILDRLGDLPLGADAYELGREGVPRVYNERLQQRIWRSGGSGFIFEDLPRRDAAGWSDGSCTLNPNAAPRRILDDANRRAIGRGTQYRDMIALVAQAVAAAPADAAILEVRRAVLARLAALSDGRSIARGLWQDWAFTSRRTSADDVLIVMRPGGAGPPTLAPWQYHRLGDSLVRVPVIDLSLDLVGLSRIDAADQSFDAEFFLSLRSEDPAAGIASISFTNAYRSQSGVGRLIDVHEISSGAGASRFPPGVKVYKVSGKFTFEPELDDFPFDTQRLTLSFEPSSASVPFLVQPPVEPSERPSVRIDGWTLDDAYVGADQDVIPVIAGAGAGKRVVAAYKYNQTFVVQRVALDFYMRVVVPLSFILLVTWFSIFLGPERFESLMGIQVTALLSAIALYLSLPDVGAESATLADRIFMVTYAAVSAMIGLSILKDARPVGCRPRLKWGVLVLQHAGLPLATAGAMLWLILSSAWRAPTGL